MKWILASERLPDKSPTPYFVKYGSNSKGTLHVDSFNKWKVTEWLDESTPSPDAVEGLRTEIKSCMANNGDNEMDVAYGVCFLFKNYR